MNKDIARLAEEVKSKLIKYNKDSDLRHWTNLQRSTKNLLAAIAAESEYKDVKVFKCEEGVPRYCSHPDNTNCDSMQFNCHQVTLLEPVEPIQFKYHGSDQGVQCACEKQNCKQWVLDARRCQPDWLKPPKKTDYKEPVEEKAEIKEIKRLIPIFEKDRRCQTTRRIGINRDKINELTKVINEMRGRG